MGNLVIKKNRRNKARRKSDTRPKAPQQLHPSTTPAKDASPDGWKRALLGLCELSRDCFNEYGKTGSEFMQQLAVILVKLQLAASTANTAFELNWMIGEGCRSALFTEYESRRKRWADSHTTPATGGAT